MFKTKAGIALAIVSLTLSSSTLLWKVAQADGSLAVTGTVPEVNTLDIIWANENIGLAATNAAANIQSVLAALKIYSNNPNGFTVKAAGAGVLDGPATSATIAYKVALFNTYADATAATPFLLKIAAGNGGADSAYTTPAVVPASIYTSGTLTVPTDTGTGAYYLGMQIAAAQVAALLADSYTDTLTVSIVGN